MLLVGLCLRLLRVCRRSAPDPSLVLLISLTLLVHLTALSCIRALWVAVSIHLPCRVLLSTIDRLLLGRILGRSWSSRWSISDWWQLRTTAHGGRHHVLRRVLCSGLSRRAILLSTISVFLALSLFISLALVFFLLLFCFPLLADFFELCIAIKG